MAQTGFTPILIYSGTTAAQAPLAANLTNSTLGSELAINITDGKLFYKDNGGVVQVIGWKVVPATAGGTGQTSYAVGDILYADTTTSLAKLSDIATGNALISGGVGVAPSWGKIGLTTHVTGTLPVANGGTGQSSNLTQYGVIYGLTTTAMASTAAGTSTQVLHGNASGAPTWSAVSLTADVSGTLPIANGGTNATATPTAGGVSYGTGTAFAFTAAGTSNYLLQSAGTGAPTWSNSINGITIGATTTANGSFATLTAKTPQVTSSTPFYHIIKTGEYSLGGGNQRPAAIIEGAWQIPTSNADIAPVDIGASDKWRMILIGAWGNYYNGFGVNGPGNYCEITSDNNTLAIGSTGITVTRNATTGYLQWVNDFDQIYGAEFQGTIIISNSGGAPSYSFNVKGGMSALGVYSTTVGATNRDVYVDNTGVIGYVSSTRESKTNIQSLDNVSWLLQLDPVQFNRRKKKPVFAPDNDRLPIGETYSDEGYDELEYGLIADDAKIINDELCFYDIDENGNKVLRGVHYSKLITPLLKLVQTQQNAIDILKSEMTAIKNGAAS
jgi:hypothetical protein